MNEGCVLDLQRGDDYREVLDINIKLSECSPNFSKSEWFFQLTDIN